MFVNRGQNTDVSKRWLMYTAHTYTIWCLRRICSVQLGITKKHPPTYTRKFSQWRPTGVAGIAELKNKTPVNGSSKDLVFTLLEYNSQASCFSHKYTHTQEIIPLLPWETSPKGICLQTLYWEVFQKSILLDCLPEYSSRRWLDRDLLWNHIVNELARRQMISTNQTVCMRYDVIMMTESWFNKKIILVSFTHCFNTFVQWRGSMNIKGSK